MKVAEVWKTIKGYGGRYLVSNKGRVRRRPHISSITGRVFPAKFMKQWKRVGYWCVGLTDNNGEHFVSVHRLVAKAFIPNPERKPYVNHIDGTRTNNLVSNLEWCTAKENAQHAAKQGKLLDKRGEGHHMVKLSDAIVAKIRRLYRTGKFSQREIGVRFGVLQSTVSRVVTNQRWSHI